MRYGPEHNEAARERILGAASRLFREHGVAAVGLAKIMAAADLTVGAFYTHFESKEALLREFETNSKLNNFLLSQLTARYQNGEDPAGVWRITDFYNRIDKAMIHACFDYPFNVLGCNQVLAFVPSGAYQLWMRWFR